MAIRDAATKARSLGQMIDAEQAAKVSDAVKAARKAATEIVRRVEKAGESGEEVLRDLRMGRVYPRMYEKAPQRTVAQAVGISRARLAQLERGHRPIPLKVFNALCDHFAIELVGSDEYRGWDWGLYVKAGDGAVQAVARTTPAGPANQHKETT